MNPDTNTEHIPDELAECYDSPLEFAWNVQKFWNIDECLAYPCYTTLDHALHLARKMDYDDFLPFYWMFVEICADRHLLRLAEHMLNERKPYYRQVRY